MFKEKMNEVEERLQLAKDELHHACQNLIQKATPETKWWFQMCVDDKSEEHNKVEKELNRWRFYHGMALGHLDNDNARLEIAKSVPVKDILGSPVKESANRAFYPCPIHKEKTPSMVWYKEQRSFYCFGCHAHGDAIDLVMKTQGIDFKEALSFLTK